MDEASIQSLLENHIVEGHHLDYKETFPFGRGPSDDSDFLTDVVAFANADGGDIIYGIEEQKGPGWPKAIPGIANFLEDDARKRLQSLVAAHVEPPLAFRLRVISGSFSKGPVVVVRVSRSWIGPHMISRVPRQSNDKEKLKVTSFHVRRNAGNDIMRHDDIRRAFLGSQELPERMRRFRDQRLLRLLAGEAPLAMKETEGCAVLQVFPMASLHRPTVVDVRFVRDEKLLPSPVPDERAVPHLNADGLMMRARHGHTARSAYLQLFRNGVVEVAFKVVDGQGRGRELRPGKIEARIQGILPAIVALYIRLNIDPPAAVFVSLVGVRDAIMKSESSTSPGGHGQPLEDAELLLPEVLFETWQHDLKETTRPTFDALWQAGGFDGSPSCDLTSTDG
jgi:hypothetical protein